MATKRNSAKVKQAESKDSGSSIPRKNNGRSSGKQGSSRSPKNSKNSRGKKSQEQADLSLQDSLKDTKQTVMGTSSKSPESVLNQTETIQEDELTSKQDLFCREYLIDLNATQAAIRAGYSKETAGAIGHENLKKPEIQRRISSYMRDRMKRVEVSQEMVIRELCKIAFANIKEFLHLDENGNTMFIDFDEVDSDKATAISEVTVMYTPAGNKKTKMKMHDKMEALKLIGQHLGMFKIGIDATTGGKPFTGEYDLSRFSTDQLKTFMELTRILNVETK